MRLEHEQKFGAISVYFILAEALTVPLGTTRRAGKVGLLRGGGGAVATGSQKFKTRT